MRLPLSVRTYVLGLILVVVVPLLGFSGFLVLRTAQHEQEILGATVRQKTRAAARDIEREISSLRAQLFVLANVDEPGPAYFAALYARASAAFEHRGLMLVLSNPDGQELIDTHLPLDATLPDFADLQAVHQVVATGQPFVSDLTTSTVTHKAVLMVSVPVLQRGKVAYVASMDVLPALTRIMLQQQLPPDWIATVGDRQGVTITRSRDPQHFVGQLGRPRFLQRLQEAEEGWLPFDSREGIPMYIAFSHVNPVGWAVVVGIPINVLYAPVRHSTQMLTLAGIAMLGIALLLASLIGRRIGRPIDALVTYAQEVGREQPLEPRLTGLRETDAVARSLHQASENLRQSREQQETAAAALRESEQQYRVLASDLARAGEERKQLLHRTVLVQEAERKRIARELHDSLGQYLTALQLGLSSIEPACGPNEQAVRRLSELKALTADVGTELNRIAWELRPTILDDLGLEVAISQYLEEWSERCKLHFDLQFDLGNQRLPQTVETTLYRVLQEAVTNVVRHAEATRVGVILKVTDHIAQLIVEDDGKGFCVAGDGRSDGPTHQLGLIGMRERLALLNGSMEVETGAGSGTTLFIRVPL